MDINKPVAWMDENENVIFEKNWAYPIPLYTHPVKELTDEDIANIWAEHTKIGGTYDVKDIVFPFAKAILRKAQEK